MKVIVTCAAFTFGIFETATAQCSTYYADTDNDGFGSSSDAGTVYCSDPGAGYSLDNTDCDDAQNAVHPSATEICNGIDDDCAGGVDNGLTFTTYYNDNDGDGYGDNTYTTSSCGVPPGGFISDNTDCDDDDANVNPGKTEVCNSIDDNCDGSNDEGVITATVTPESSPAFCKGESVILDANTGPGYTYVWKRNGNNIVGATGSTYTVTKDGSYRVVITIPGGCFNFAEPVDLTMSKTPDAVISPMGSLNICSTGRVKLKANGGVGLTYQWYLNGAPISGATTVNFLANIPGDYQVQTTNSGGCTKMSTVIPVTSDCGGRFANTENTEKIEIYPNPAGSVFTVNVFTGNQNSEAGTIQIYDMTGTLIRNIETNAVSGNINTQVDTDKMPAGIYLVKASIGNTEFSSRLTITH